jgi:general secretion pathway protein G
MRRTIGLVVFAFIAVLLIDAFGFRPLWRSREGVPAIRVQIEALGLVLEDFRRDVGRYPTSDEGLRALRERPADLASWRGPYVREDVPPDPWGRPFVYRSTGLDYELSSLGADGRPGGTGSNADYVRSPSLASRPPS